MLFEIFHFLFIIGWIGDLILLVYCLIKLYHFNILCLIYPTYYLFVEFFEYMPFFDYISNIYIENYKAYFKYEYTDEKENMMKYINNGKKEIIILGPHGMFMTAPISSGIFGMNRQYAKTFKLFVAPILSMNPMVNLISKMIQSGNKVEALNHKNVIKNLKENKYNLCVSAGGFDEINLYSNKHNVIWDERWLYWIYNAIKYGYNINFCYCYGGTNDYRSLLDGQTLLDFRHWCAKHYIPFNLCYGRWLIFPFNDVPLTEIFFHMELPYNPNISKFESLKYLYEFNDKCIELLNKNKPSCGQDNFYKICSSNYKSKLV